MNQLPQNRHYPLKKLPYDFHNNTISLFINIYFTVSMKNVNMILSASYTDTKREIILFFKFSI